MHSNYALQTDTGMSTNQEQISAPKGFSIIEKTLYLSPSEVNTCNIRMSWTAFHNFWEQTHNMTSYSNGLHFYELHTGASLHPYALLDSDEPLPLKYCSVVH